MLSEPKSKQQHKKEIYQFVVLNHVLSSNVASLTSNVFNNNQLVSKDNMVRVKSSMEVLEKSFLLLNADGVINDGTEPPVILSDNNRKDTQLSEQLNFIQKISNDIGKLTNVIAG
jgi:hypothetical protein